MKTASKYKAETIDSMPEAIADGLAQIGQIDRAVIEPGRMSPVICLGLKRLGEAVQGLLAVREILLDQVAWLDRLLKEIAASSTACQILMTIPGVGVQTAAAFAAAIDDADRFRRSCAAGA